MFIVERKPKDASIRPRRVLDCKSVTQIEVLEQHAIVLVLADKTLYSYSTDALEPDESQAIVKRPRKICHANFFKAGICLGQQLVAAVKTSALSTTIKVYEPKEQMGNKNKKSGFAKMMLSTGGADQLKPYKEFYIPTESTSIHFLRSKLCVGCARGFEVVSLETLETQSLLDQADTSLDFVVRKENIKPIHIERMASEFLLCYTDYSFFVNRNGWRARPDWKITWEGTPAAFAIFNPYILAFEPSFIEIRHMESGGLVHIITGKNIRWLHTSTREVCRNKRLVFQAKANMPRYYTHTRMNSAMMSSPAWTFGKQQTRSSHSMSNAPTKRARCDDQASKLNSMSSFYPLTRECQSSGCRSSCSHLRCNAMTSFADGHCAVSSTYLERNGAGKHVTHLGRAADDGDNGRFTSLLLSFSYYVLPRRDYLYHIRLGAVIDFGQRQTMLEMCVCVWMDGFEIARPKQASKHNFKQRLSDIFDQCLVLFCHGLLLSFSV